MTTSPALPGPRVRRACISPPRAPRVHLSPVSEHAAQCVLFDFVALLMPQYPELALLHAIPNGGFRNKATAHKLAAEGVRPGVWDIAYPVPKMDEVGDGGIYTGLRIEMKVEGQKPRKNQVLWGQAVSICGELCAVCHGFDEAKEVIERYNGLLFPEWLNVPALRAVSRQYWDEVTTSRVRRTSARRGQLARGW